MLAEGGPSGEDMQEPHSRTGLVLTTPAVDVLFRETLGGVA